MKTTSEQRGDAVNRFLKGEFESLRKTERKTDVSRQTISARLARAKSYHKAHANQQKLSPVMEKDLMDQIMMEDQTDCAPGYPRLRAIAEGMLIAAGKTGQNAILGEKQHLNFTEHHENVRAAYARKIDIKQVKAESKKSISAVFQRYQKIITTYKIAPRNHWNMDESDLQVGDTGREKCLMKYTDLNHDDPIIKKPLSERQNTTIKTISVTGEKINPLCIFTGENI